MRKGEIFFIVIGVFILLVVMVAYLGATYGGIVDWTAFAGALIGIGIVLMFVSND